MYIMIPNKTLFYSFIYPTDIDLEKELFIPHIERERETRREGGREGEREEKSTGKQLV